MWIFKTVQDLQNWVKTQRNEGKTIGFVPTMGALHQGHISLINRSKQVSDFTVASIFVNPTQFNDPKDLEKYPRTPEKDAILLQQAGCDVLFLPTVDEIYPRNLNTSLNLNLGSLAEVMDGAFRPGHFNGMCQVVKRLLDIVNPQFLIMGQKDFQQFSIVKSMIKKLKLKVNLIMGSTLREINGLAMSSRNERLHPDERKKAKVIYESLLFAKELLKLKLSIALIEKKCTEKIEKTGFPVEYFSLVDGNTLLPVLDAKSHDLIVACVAVRTSTVRLIDNLPLKGKP
jgi:pantoate--beta-alanine ligase